MIDALAAGVNVVVASVAGSGKTSTCLCFARACPTSRVLLLTYNARLKEESRVRVAEAGLGEAVEVHSYNSLGYRYYHDSCSRDLVSVVRENFPLQSSLPPFTHILIDEAQDVTPTIFAFLVKFLSDLRASHGPYARPPVYGVFGDELQAVYTFAMSDVRYLTHAAQVLPSNGAPWRHLRLRVSYRLPGHIAAFLNDVVLGLQGHIVPVKAAGLPVRYLRGSPWKIAEWVSRDIARKLFGCAARAAVTAINTTTSYKVERAGNPPFVELRGECDVVPVPRTPESGGLVSAFTELVRDEFASILRVQHAVLLGSSLDAGLRFPRTDPTATPSDIMVVAASIKESVTAPGATKKASPFRRLENLLSQNGIGIYIKAEDAAGSEVAAGKVLLSSFVACKGLERRSVYAMGMSASHFTFFARDVPPAAQLRAPNDIFVALSRASEELIVSGENSEGPLPFLRLSSLCLPSVVVEDVTPRGKAPQELPEKPRRLLVGSLLEHVPEVVLRTALDGLVFTCLTPGGTIISVPTIVDGTLSAESAAGGDSEAATPKELRASSKELVSHLTGLAIPAMLETSRTGSETEPPSCAMLNEVRCPSIVANMHPSIRARVKALPQLTRSSPPAYFLELAALWNASASVGMQGLISPVMQIRAFDWLTPSAAAACVQRLRERITDWEEGKFEVLRMVCHEHRKMPLEIAGQFDCITPTTLWELKCVSGQLSSSHKLQLALYAWLHQHPTPKEEMMLGADAPVPPEGGASSDCLAQPFATAAGPSGTSSPSARALLPCALLADSSETSASAPPMSYRLLNVLSGESWELSVRSDSDQAALNATAQLLLRRKLDSAPALDDDTFLAISAEAVGAAALVPPPFSAAASPPRLAAATASERSTPSERALLSPAAASAASAGGGVSSAGGAASDGGRKRPGLARSGSGGGGGDGVTMRDGLSPPPKLPRMAREEAPDSPPAAAVATAGAAPRHLQQS